MTLWLGYNGFVNSFKIIQNLYKLADKTKGRKGTNEGGDGDSFTRTGNGPLTAYLTLLTLS